MNTFFELSLILVIATVVAGITKILKQPLVVGYIIAGLIVGPAIFGIFKSVEVVQVFSEMGITILLFIVGLHLNPKELKNYGKSILLIGFLQLVITALLALGLCLRLGFSFTSSIYLSLGLTFSSTIVVLKLLADKKELEGLHGKISIGILLLQDIAAAIALIVAGTAGGSGSSFLQILEIIIKGIGVTLVLSIASLYLLPKLCNFFAKSQEYLFLFSLGWGFGIATLFNALGFSIEIGALMAGVALSISPYSQEISAKLRPLRDFFTIMFFIVLGSQLRFSDLSNLILPIIIFLLFVLIIKPIIIISLSGFFGYSKKTSFTAGISHAQISEFSMILVLLGVKLGHINQSISSIITFVGMVTILVSSYFINYSEKMYLIFSKYLDIFERKNKEKKVKSISNYDVILFGCHRGGYDFIEEFKKLGNTFLAVDFDPDIIKELTDNKINCAYGDASDGEFLDDINIDKAKVVVSTVPEYETNVYLLKKIRGKDNEKTIIILLSYDIEEAIKLYEQGATYVILPHFVGGEYTANLAKEADFDIKKLYKKRNKHMDYLKQRKYLGHSHPKWNHHY